MRGSSKLQMRISSWVEFSLPFLLEPVQNDGSVFFFFFGFNVRKVLRQYSVYPDRGIFQLHPHLWSEEWREPTWSSGKVRPSSISFTSERGRAGENQTYANVYFPPYTSLHFTTEILRSTAWGRDSSLGDVHREVGSPKGWALQEPKMAFQIQFQIQIVHPTDETCVGSIIS